MSASKENNFPKALSESLDFEIGLRKLFWEESLEGDGSDFAPHTKRTIARFNYIIKHLFDDFNSCNFQGTASERADVVERVKSLLDNTQLMNKVLQMLGDDWSDYIVQARIIFKSIILKLCGTRGIPR